MGGGRHKVTTPSGGYRNTRHPTDTTVHALPKGGGTYKLNFAVDAPLLLAFLLLLILLFLFVLLGDDVVQVAEVVLGEDVVHRLADGDQSQDLCGNRRQERGAVQLGDGLFLLGRVVARYHDGEDDGSHGGLEDPQEGQAQGLDEGEEVDASLWDVAQVDEVRLVLGGHQEQLQPVHELAGSGKIFRCQCAEESRQKTFSR